MRNIAHQQKGSLLLPFLIIDEYTHRLAGLIELISVPDNPAT